MATYKKRGYKPSTKKEENQIDESKYETAGVLYTLEQTANKSEKWIEKNNKILFGILVGVVLVFLGYFAYNQFVKIPSEKEASNELAFPRKYFDEATTAATGIDSLLNLSLEGADGNYGFLDIADKYSSTKAGNLANYYAGIAYLRMKDYKKGIEFLSKFDSDDQLLGPIALGAIGDAFSDLNQLNDALDYYKKAANKAANEFSTPLFLFKAGQTALMLEKFSEAEDLFEEIKADYAKSEQGTDIDKYINAAKYAQ